MTHTHEDRKAYAIKHKHDWMELTNGADNVLIVNSEDRRTINVFLNGDYLFDAYLSQVSDVKEDFLNMFIHNIERQRDKAYPPCKGYYKLYTSDTVEGDPSNPLGLTGGNLKLFNKMLIAGANTLTSNSELIQANTLLEWLGVKP